MNLARIDTLPDGGVLIAGSLIYDEPAAPDIKPGARVPRHGKSPTRFRFFNATLKRSPAGWRVVDVAVAQGA